MKHEELMLRKMIIDGDVESVNRCKLIEDENDFTNFLITSSDICLVINEETTAMDHQVIMMNLLMNGHIAEHVVKELLIKLYGAIKELTDIKARNFVTDLIFHIVVNDHNTNIDPLLKSMIIMEMSKKGIDYKRILEQFITRGKVHDELLSKFESDVDFSILSSNPDVDLEVIDKYSYHNDYDWGLVSCRNDLSATFVIKHVDQLLLDAVFYNNIDNKDFCIFLLNKFSNPKVDNGGYKLKQAWMGYLVSSPTCDYDVEETLLLYNLDKGYLQWDTIHLRYVLHATFIMKYKDKLNIEEILKYYILADETRKRISSTESSI